METELCGEQLYKVAIASAVNPDLAKEWKKYLEETAEHQEHLRKIFGVAGLDVDTETPGRMAVRAKGEALVAVVKAAKKADAKLGELVAAESAVETESKDHQNWELLGRMAKHMAGALADALQEAYDEVGEEEAEHLFHTMGWSRELWLDYLGVPSVLPPPEEQKGGNRRSVTLISPTGETRHVAASDEAALRFVKLQTETGEGPCVTAYRSGETVAIPDLSKDSRLTP